MIDTSPFPLIKTRKEVREMIKNLYEFYVLSSLSKDYHAVKQKAELDTITEWDKFWSKACQMTSNARYLGNDIKVIICNYFKKGVKGELMINSIKKIKPLTNSAVVEKMFTKIYETLKKED
jgi:hypothetical protein